MKCVICGSKIKTNSTLCNSCGARQDVEPTYHEYINVSEYLKQNNLEEIPNKEDFEFIQDGKYMIYKGTSKYDLVALSSCALGLYFTFKYISNMSSGINGIITKNSINNTINNPVIKILFIIWPIIIFPLISFIYSKKARKIKKNNYNIYSYLGSILELSYACATFVILFINI